MASYMTPVIAPSRLPTLYFSCSFKLLSKTGNILLPMTRTNDRLHIWLRNRIMLPAMSLLPTISFHLILFEALPKCEDFNWIHFENKTEFRFAIEFPYESSSFNFASPSESVLKRLPYKIPLGAHSLGALLRNCVMSYSPLPFTCACTMKR